MKDFYRQTLRRYRSPDEHVRSDPYLYQFCHWRRVRNCVWQMVNARRRCRGSNWNYLCYSLL